MRPAPLIVALLCVGCGFDNEGLTPPTARLNFPISVALTSDASHLFVVNSNFDLRYNAGSVQAFDVAAIEAELAACAAPGPSCVVAPETALVNEVLIGAHASSLALSASERRLYLAVRSDTNLTYVDWDPAGGLNCGGNGRHTCVESFRRGDEAIATERAVVLPSDPVGVVSGSLAQFTGRDESGDFVMMAHRSGEVSLFVDRTEEGGTAPALVHLVSGLPSGSVNIRYDASTRSAWVPATGTTEIGRVSVAADEQSRDLLRSFAYDSGTLRLSGFDVGEAGGDVRDIEFEGDRAYVLMRIPEAVAIVDLGAAAGRSVVPRDLVEIGSGPSRLALAHLDVGRPTPKTLVIATCFDSRDAFVIDAERASLLTVIRGLGGPFEVAVNDTSGHLYFADFRSSSVRIVSLEPLARCLREGAQGQSCEPQLLGTLGAPYVIGELN